MNTTPHWKSRRPAAVLPSLPCRLAARRSRWLACTSVLAVALHAQDQTVSGNLTVTAAATVQSTTASTSKDTGALIVEGGAGIEGSLFAGGNISATLLIASGGTVQASALTAGGANQGITLTPSGTGTINATAKFAIAPTSADSLLELMAASSSYYSMVKFGYGGTYNW